MITLANNNEYDKTKRRKHKIITGFSRPLIRGHIRRIRKQQQGGGGEKEKEEEKGEGEEHKD